MQGLMKQNRKYINKKKNPQVGRHLACDKHQEQGE